MRLARDIWGGLSSLLKGEPKPETYDNVETLTKQRRPVEQDSGFLPQSCSNRNELTTTPPLII